MLSIVLCTCWPNVCLLSKNCLFREFSGSLVVRTQCFHCCGLGSMPGWGTKIPQAARRGQKKSVQILCPFFNQTACCFAIELYEFFLYFGYKPLVDFCFCCLCFGVKSKKSSPRLMSRSLLPMFLLEVLQF